MSDLVDELLDTLDLVDDNSQVIENAKLTVLSSLGAGKIGDRNPVTPKDVESWRKLRDEYLSAIRKGHAEYAGVLSAELFGKTLDLIHRSFTSNNSTSMFHRLSERWKTRKRI
jgi:hypothetical protein